MNRFVLPFLALAACGGGTADQPVPAPAVEPAPTTAVSATDCAHAAAGYVPGSHEDWCVGHGVPESQCTRCNPSLIPAFQATGDWCAEHGLPMSQCLQCNPDLKIERPPKEG